jgi:hypothetical protein
MSGPKGTKAGAGGGKGNAPVSREEFEKYKEQEAKEDAARDRRLAIVENKQEVIRIYLKWKDKFEVRMNSYQLAVDIIANGVQTAAAEFKKAQDLQALQDQMRAQLLGLVLSFTAAGSLQWIFTTAFGKIGMSADNIQKYVEIIENPAVAAVQGYASGIRPVSVAKDSYAKGQQPDTTVPGGGKVPGGDAVLFLTAQSAALRRRWGGILGKFKANHEKWEKMSADDWVVYDVRALEAGYQQVYNDFDKAGNGAEVLRPQDEVALIVERHMWAHWILRSAKLYHGWAEQKLGVNPAHPGPELQNFGKAINRRLIEIGVESMAGVGLCDTFWCRNSDEWSTRVFAWARNYSASILVETRQPIRTGPERRTPIRSGPDRRIPIRTGS